MNKLCFRWVCFLLANLIFLITVRSQETLVMAGFGIGEIELCDTEGNNIERFLDYNGAGATGLNIDDQNRFIYWIVEGNILRADFNASALDTLIQSDDILYDLALDISGNKMYWSNSTTDQLYVSDLLGQNPQVLIANDNTLNVISLAFYPQSNILFYGNLSGDIGRISLNTTTDTVILNIDNLATEIEIDKTEQKLYWSNQSLLTQTSRIQRSNFDGSEIEDLVTDLGNTWGLALSSNTGKIFWTDWDDDYYDVRSANLDGSEVSDVYKSENINPYSLAITSSILTEVKEEPESKEICVYPNPAHSKVKLERNFDFDQILIFDQWGRDILSFESSIYEIDLSGFQEGVYFLSAIKDGRSVSVLKIVKI